MLLLDLLIKRNVHEADESVGWFSLNVPPCATLMRNCNMQAS